MVYSWCFNDAKKMLPLHRKDSTQVLKKQSLSRRDSNSEEARLFKEILIFWFYLATPGSFNKQQRVESYWKRFPRLDDYTNLIAIDPFSSDKWFCMFRL